MTWMKTLRTNQGTSAEGRRCAVRNLITFNSVCVDVPAPGPKRYLRDRRASSRLSRATRCSSRVAKLTLLAAAKPFPLDRLNT